MLHVYTLYGQPQDQQQIVNERKNQDAGKQHVRQRGQQQQREAMDQLTRSGNRQKHAKNLREVARLELQIALNQTRKPKEYEPDGKAKSVRFNREVRQRVQSCSTALLARHAR